MSDLSEFLLARIAEDEREPLMVRDGWTDLADVLPMGCWDSPRVLAECEAKRLVVERWQATAPPYSDARQQEIHETLKEEVLPLLALPYASHPDYDEAWRP